MAASSKKEKARQLAENAMKKRWHARSGDIMSSETKSVTVGSSLALSQKQKRHSWPKTPNRWLSDFNTENQSYVGLSLDLI